MLKKEEVYSLVKSMSQSEKRHFHIENDNGGKKPNHLKLFELMDAQSAYDEELVKKAFEGEKCLKQFHVLKNYLRQRIMRSLRGFHASSSKRMELANCLSNIEILFNRELYQPCRAELRKAESLASKLEYLPALFEVQDWKRKLRQNENPNDYVGFEEVLNQQGDTLDKLENRKVYNHLILDISKSIRESSKRVVENEYLLSNAENATNFESGVMHHNALYFRSIQKQNPEVSRAALNKLDKFFDNHQIQIQHDPGLYISSMNNSIGYFVFNKDYDQSLVLINKVKDFYKKVRLTNENKTLLKQVLRLHSIELEVYRSLGITNERKKEVEDIQALVSNNRYKMPKDYLIAFWFQFANIDFSEEKFSDSLVWVNEILNHRFGSTRPDLQLHTRFLNLMIHLERQNLFVLRYYVDSTRRFVKKLKVDDEFIKLLLRFFSKIGKAPLLDYKSYFQELRNYILEEDKEVNRPRSGYIDYLAWASKHI